MSGSFENHFTVAWWMALIMIVSAMAALMASFSDRAFNLIHDRVLGRFRNNRIAMKFRKFHETYCTYRNNPRSLVSFSALNSGRAVVGYCAIVAGRMDCWCSRGNCLFRGGRSVVDSCGAHSHWDRWDRNRRGGVRLSAFPGQHLRGP